MYDFCRGTIGDIILSINWLRCLVGDIGPAIIGLAFSVSGVSVFMYSV